MYCSQECVIQANEAFSSLHRDAVLDIHKLTRDTYQSVQSIKDVQEEEGKRELTSSHRVFLCS